MVQDTAIDVLKELITVNQDRIKAYKSAQDSSEEHDLISLFGRFAKTSERCKGELVRQVEVMGDEVVEVAEGIVASDKFFRVWMEVKAALKGKDRKAILNSCEYGEDRTVAAYQDALHNKADKLNAEQKAMVMKQKDLIQIQHDHIKTMRDALMNTKLGQGHEQVR